MHPRFGDVFHPLIRVEFIERRQRGLNAFTLLVRQFVQRSRLTIQHAVHDIMQQRAFLGVAAGGTRRDFIN